jgi:hypothetical protein
MKGMQLLAAGVTAARRPVAPDNPLLELQTKVSTQITTALDSYRDARDKLEEQIFFGFYGSPFVQALLGINEDTRSCDLPPKHPPRNWQHAKARRPPISRCCGVEGSTRR